MVAPQDPIKNMPIQEVHIVLSKEKNKTHENCIKKPIEPPHYRNTWPISDFYDTPLDWREQESRYDQKEDGQFQDQEEEEVPRVYKKNSRRTPPRDTSSKPNPANMMVKT
jgi:hypothetical protein